MLSKCSKSPISVTHELRKHNVCWTNIYTRLRWKCLNCCPVEESNTEAGLSWEEFLGAGQIWFFSPVFKLGVGQETDRELWGRRGRIHFLQPLICFLTKAGFQNKLRFLPQRNDSNPVSEEILIMLITMMMIILKFCEVISVSVWRVHLIWWSPVCLMLIKTARRP